MKKFIICAAAAIVALASCSKTQVVYNDAPEEINFKAVSGVMTKALGDKEYETMGVFAHQNNVSYFGNTSFAPSGDVWVANPAQYWPLSGDLDFAFYAPYNNTSIVKRIHDGTTNTLAINVNNATVGSQIDWLYGTEVKTASKQNTAIDVALRHALARIDVKVTSDLDGLTITSLTIKDAAHTSLMTIDYDKTDVDLTNGDSRLSWGDASSADLTLNLTTEALTTSASCYVIPSDQTSIVMKYKLSAASNELTYTHSLNKDNAKWVDGFKYTYNINITANEIKFNPTVSEWGTGGEDITVDPNTSNNTPNN